MRYSAALCCEFSARLKLKFNYRDSAAPMENPRDSLREALT